MVNRNELQIVGVTWVRAAWAALLLVSMATRAMGAGGSVTYTYDDAGRLDDVTYSEGSKIDYTLDAAGNRITVIKTVGGGALQWVQSSYAVSESVGTVTLSVSRTGSSNGTVTAQFGVTGGTAMAGSDYAVASGTLSWSAGDTENKTVSIQVADDGVFENNETIVVSLSNPTGGALLGSVTQTIITIADNDAVTFSIGNVSVNEAAGTAAVTVTKNGGTAFVHAVNYGTTDGTAIGGTHYTATSGTLTFSAAEASKIISVPVINNAVFQGTKTFSAALSAPTNGATIASSTAIVTILDDEPAPTFSIDDRTVPEDAGTVVFTVTKTGATAYTHAVDYGTANGSASSTPIIDFIATSGTLSFLAAETSKTVTVTLSHTANSLYEGNETFQVNLSSPTNGAVLSDPTGLCTLTDVNPTNFAVGSPTVTEGAALIFNVLLTRESTLTHAVSYSTSNGTAVSPGDYTAASGTLTFLPGETSKTVSVPTVNDTTPESTEAMTFTLSGATNGATLGTATGTGTIQDNDDTFPGVPLNLRTNPVGSAYGSYTVLWDTASGVVTYYELQRAQSSSFPSPTTYTISAPTTSMGFTAGAAEHDFDFRVRSCNSSAQCSGWSATVHLWVDGTGGGGGGGGNP